MTCGGHADGSPNRNSKRVSAVASTSGCTWKDTAYVFHGLIQDHRNAHPNLNSDEVEELASRHLDMALSDPDSLPDECAITRDRVLQVGPAGKILNADTPLTDEILSILADLDDEQKHDVVSTAYEATLRRLAREKVAPQAPVDPEAWQEWCQKQAARCEEAGRDDLAARYLGQAATPPRNAAEFETLKRLRYRSLTSVKSLERELRQVAGLHDIDMNAASDAFTKARAEFLSLPPSERPGVPEWHTKAVSFSYFGRDAAKKPPLDPATAYALYTVTHEPARTASAPRRGRGYVVFDTETTGIESDAAILQVTAIAYDAHGVEIDRVSTYVHPGFDGNGDVYVGSEAAVAAHGITPQMLEGAPTFADIAPRISEVFSDRTRVAHNLNFDWPKVQRAMSLAGAEPLSSGPQVDTLRLARYRQPNPGVPSKEWKHTLQAACLRAGLEFDEEKAHNSAYDVDRTAAFYKQAIDPPAEPKSA